MPIPRRYRHGQWPSQAVFILAAAGACIGLGNLWRFPVLVLEYGGGAFLLAYLAALLLLALPIAVGEVILGRATRHDPVGACREAALLHARSPRWQWAGGLAVFAALLLLVLLAVSAGWGMGYLLRTVTGALAQLDVVDAAALFRELAMDLERSMFWTTLFLAGVLVVVSRGLQAGVVPAVLLLVPLLFIGLAALLAVALQRPTFPAAFFQVFGIEFSRLGREGVLMALQHAFSTVAVGAGVLIAFGAALDQRVPVISTVSAVILLDVFAGLVGALAIVSLAPGITGGSSLAFEILPTVFAALDGGRVIAFVFYAVIVLAALTSGVALAEAVVTALVGGGRLGRGGASLVAGVVAWFLALFLVLSHASSGIPLGAGTVELREVLDVVAGRFVPFLLMLAALGVLLVVGWGVASQTVRHAVRLDGRPWLFLCCLGMLRLVAPALLLTVVAFTLFGR